VEARRQLTDGERVEVHGLLAAARRADRHEPLAEHKRIALDHGDAAAHGFVAFLFRGEGGTLTGYAQLAPARDAMGLEVVVHPSVRESDGDDGVAGALVRAAAAEVAGGGGGTLRYFLADPSPERVAGAERLGFALDRRFLQMAVALPLAPEVVDAATRSLAALTLRAFRPGHDEAQWLEVNARAFATHAEQGTWTLDDLRDREAAPWFDPAGFLVAESGDRLVASCLTKVHRALDPPTGEIYVISVDPDWHGKGLGRAMTVAGLDHLASRGMRRGVLYVDEDNTAAVATYRSLGFDVDHVDRAYVRAVPGS
jgi:mycothiol synthase